MYLKSLSKSSTPGSGAVTVKVGVEAESSSSAFVGVLWAEAVDGPQSTILAIGAPGRNSSA